MAGHGVKKTRSHDSGAAQRARSVRPESELRDLRHFATRALRSSRIR
jgi:hypothetical protein